MLKSFPKILIIFFLTVFIFQLSCLLFLALAPAVSQAADPATFKPQVEIPGMKEEFGAVDPKTKGYAIPGSTASIAKYIRVIYKYAIGIVGILAAVVLMVGGVMWIVAGGSATRIGEAKAWIASSLTGLLLALLSYTILATVNPALVNFQVSEVKPVKEIKMSAQTLEESYCFGSYEGSDFSGTIIRGQNEEYARATCNKYCKIIQLKSSVGYCCSCKSGTTLQVSNCKNVANGTPCTNVSNGFCYDNVCTAEAGDMEMDSCGPINSNAICLKREWIPSHDICPYRYHMLSRYDAEKGRECNIRDGLVCCIPGSQ